ncbi:putative oxidoreductase [Cadophora sp. DSE1049]|nr:putative oxidoreductase [Cadophora sp. DSE1049]
MPSPIRIGLVGLGKGPLQMGPGIWGASVHLPYLLASPKYTLVAVQNSTVESALASIKHHKLGPDIKAYGTPEDLAQDPNVDLVVVSIVVTHHYAVTKPALLAGKGVFIEWPLAATTVEAEELTKIADENGCKTIVGLQARASPLVLKIKDIVQSGKIGKILSSTVVGQISSLKPFGTWQEGAKYYADMDSGANGFYVSFGHFLDTFTHILGPFTSLSSILHTHYPTISLINSSGSTTTPSHPKTSPDVIFVSGTLASHAIVSLSHIAAPVDPVDGTGLRWNITGSEGALEITIPKDMPWQMGPPASLKGRFGRDGEREVLDVMWERKGEGDEEGSEIGGFPAANTRRLYEAFADVRAGVGGGKRRGEYASFGESVETSRLLDWIRREAGK